MLPLALAGSVVLTGGFLFYRRLRESWLLDASLVTFRDASSNPVEGTVILRGLLRGGELSTFTSLERDGGPLVHTATNELALEVAGERVRFAGEVGVVRGTSASSRWWKSGDGLGIGARRTFTLADGAEVLAMGTCRRARSDADYRNSAGHWELAPLPNRPHVELLATKPVTVPRPFGPVWTLCSALVAFTSLVVLFTCLDQVAVFGHAVEFDLSGVSSDSEKLNDMADHSYGDLRARVIQLSINCSRALDQASHDGLFSSGYQLAVDCDDKGMQAEILVAKGEYASAHELVADGKYDPALRFAAAVGAGDWKSAVVPAELVFSGRVDGECAVELVRYRARLPNHLDSLASSSDHCADLANHYPLVMSVQVPSTGVPAPMDAPFSMPSRAAAARDAGTDPERWQLVIDGHRAMLDDVDRHNLFVLAHP